jgi:hypothetical protein
MGACWLKKHDADKLEATKAFPSKDALCQPSIGPCLQLSPPSLQAAYTRTSMGDYLHWDQQVSGMLLLMYRLSIWQRACWPEGCLKV